MTRKDYVLIAKAINEVFQFAGRRMDADSLSAQVYIRLTASHIALALAKDNVRFDTDKFMEACTKS
jgi:hypothetical protein